MNNQTSHVLTVNSPEATAGSQSLLAVGEHKRSGLILCKAYHAEFAGPGAAVGTLVEEACTSVIAIGAPEIVRIVAHKQRQMAYSRRIQWIRWLQKITEHPDAVQRTEKLFSSFEAFFGVQTLLDLTDEVLALLIGVLPPTIATVRSQYRQPDLADELDSTAPPEPLKFRSMVIPRSPYTLSSKPIIAVPSASFFAAPDNLPCRD